MITFTGESAGASFMMAGGITFPSEEAGGTGSTDAFELEQGGTLDLEQGGTLAVQI